MRKKLFLLADDDIDDREMFCEVLAAIDDTNVCHAVADGREALDTLEQIEQLPELIFLDVNMPVVNGWQCLEKLKADVRYQDIPVIIISTSSNQREADMAKSLNAICYFTKPHSFKELQHILSVIVTNTGEQLLTALRSLEAGGSKYIHTLGV